MLGSRIDGFLAWYRSVQYLAKCWNDHVTLVLFGSNFQFLIFSRRIITNLNIFPFQTKVHLSMSSFHKSDRTWSFVKCSNPFRKTRQLHPATRHWWISLNDQLPVEVELLFMLTRSFCGFFGELEEGSLQWMNTLDPCLIQLTKRLDSAIHKPSFT